MGKKYLVVTDIHGSSQSAEIIIEKLKQTNCDKIVILGDILYHGPRNDLPKYYEPKQVINILNNYVDKIIAIKGNCDAEVDEMVLAFPLKNCASIEVGDRSYIFEHGHHLEIEDTNEKYAGSVIVYGHTHVNKITKTQDATYVNLASITIPKDNSPRTYAIIDDSGLTVYDIEDNIIANV